MFYTHTTNIKISDMPFYHRVSAKYGLKGTAWGVLNAVSDLTMHKPIKDGTKSDTLTNKMLSIAEFGEPILDKAFTILSK